ncbi:hypothetical protein H6P81_013980 [Aristolochia fimbriata]|uniref:RAVE complex protein Rav1 C-terminal domain-containing protein n=1 Tax=Aristolochia fimbriata TaxID=158543 RepID=A0AAV7EJV3_ARIFI|nr:hypothetical protein H6P81_013980 [Aristolochia fimbriata]
MSEQAECDTDDISEKLPLKLIKSQLIPPAPNRFPSAIDWLPDFGGLSWIAYGASSLLVISHFPSPRCQEEAYIGTIFEQVIETPRPTVGTAVLRAVAWSPSLPSEGEIAVGSGNTVYVYTSGSKDGTGSFCWRQISGLVQSSEVEVIKWTRSGDGLIAAGREVVLWRKKSGSWEAAWRSRTEYPQTLASTTWSIEGLAATASGSGVPQVEGSSITVLEASKRVSVYYGNGTEFVKTELFHPQPVTKLQWRPLVPKEDASTFARDVLLTCSLDGAVRLWSEIESGRPKKPVKGLPDQKLMRSFHVVAVIEVNHILKGTLSTDTHFIWATEAEDTGSKVHSLHHDSEHDVVGKCEWLVGLGPQNLLSLWAIHCLDDVSPLRFPRVSLWKRQNICASTTVICQKAVSSNPANESILVQVVVHRDRLFGPPTMCSLIELLPDNIISWSHLYREDLSIVADVSSSKELQKENDLCCYVEVLNRCGHTGRILQVALHPYSYEIEIAVTLDSNGLLLFWSVSAVSNPILGKSTLSHPAWKLLGQLDSGDLSTTAEYTTLRWAPSLLNNDLLLLLGHADGIDVFAIKISESERDRITNHRICTISFEGHCKGDVPDHIFAVPLAAENSENTISNSFVLFSIWIKEFRAVSWNVVLHTSDLLGSIDTPKGWKFESAFGNTRYYVAIKPCSSTFPYESDHITSFAVISPNNFICNQVKTPICQLATGCSDGSVKLWRTSCTVPSGQVSVQMLVPWELVGVCTSHQGAVHAVSLSSDGAQMATITKIGSSSGCSLHIWGSKYLDGTGRFLLEDKMTLEGNAISLEWLAIGNGQLLGVCLQDELLIYASQRSSTRAPTEPRMSTRVWVCVATSTFKCPAQDFMWDPSLGAIVVHDAFFSLFSQWAVCTEETSLLSERNETVGNYFTVKNDSELCNSVELMSQEKVEHGRRSACHNIVEIVEKLNEPLPVYHPVALFLSLSSGRWKRAYAAVKHLVEHLNSDTNSGNCRKGYNLGKSCIHIPQILLSQFLEETVATKMSSKGLQWSTDLSSGTYGADSQVYADTISNSSTGNSDEIGLTRTLVDKFHDIEGISKKNRTELLAIVDLLSEVKDSRCSSLYESLDASGRRFWIAVKFQMHLLQKNARLAGSELIVDSGLIAWAFMSDCQDNLLNSLLSSEPTWQEMRGLGVGYWFRDVTPLRTRMEKLARSQYLKKRDPKDCALLYLALNRLQVLAGLFKISKDERDKPLVGFLARNFQDERNKAAALKNAYVLMGKHQLELAIAFFILGGDPSSAVTICAKNFGDEQLALVICRLLEGYGGALERRLISDFLLPSAIEKEDYWLMGLFEWILGNCSKSFWNLLGLKEYPTNSNSNDSSSYAYALSDPNVGQYCAFLAAKSNMKNSIGEYKAAIMARWASLMAFSALKRCGHPFEALESLQPSSINIESKDQFNSLESVKGDIFHGKQKWSAVDTSDWVADDVARDLEAHAKIGLAMFYISKMMKEHPNWTDYSCCKKEGKTNQCEVLLDNFNHKLKNAVSIFEKKFSLASHDLACKTLLFTASHGLFFLGYQVSRGFLSREHQHDSYLYPLLREQVMKTTRDICSVLVRYIVVCSLACHAPEPASCERSTSINHRSSLIHPWDFYAQYLIYFLNDLRPLIQFHAPGLFEDIQGEKIFSILDLLEYSVNFASAWAKRESHCLVLMIKPIIKAFRKKQTTEVKVTDLKVILHEIMKLVTADVSCEAEGTAPQNKPYQGVNRKTDCSLSEDERWRLIGVCLWGYLCHFMNDQVNMLKANLENEESISRLLKTTLTYVSYSLSKLLESDLRQKIRKSLPVPTLAWLEKSTQSENHEGHEYVTRGVGDLDISEESNTSSFEILWQMSVDPKEVSEGFLQDAVHHLQSISEQHSKSWSNIHKSIFLSHGYGETSNHVESRNNSAADNSDKWIYRNAQIFHNPKELCKRSGELIEAMCVNSISQKQVAFASNRKGLIFYNWDVEDSLEDKEYIWLNSDWPLNGWARSESTPVPTYVSLGVGLGSKKGAHLGLGGATVGVGSLARPGRDLTGGGAFGIPGYAGIGASGLGWEESEDFEFVDPPATVENIHTRALCSHPSGPFFLVGSSNTHIYLWEFGKNRATATYGVQPAANVPPPYALASISEVQFDHCGHRFASAALDGTICTWQLEVGGRSNVRPTQSCLCFSGYALDVEYMAGSGSVIAGAGYSSNGANVVVWDTLAPPTSSQASLTCHEGGACSLSLFDNDIGSGSISPMIVSGGKEGDVGLHDFRFIATGKSKRHKFSGLGGEKQSTRQYPSGMLWYIPKAHQGSITRISTIPYTSLFLTGSKDGDVKLWDARRQELVFHWQKLHERHTFLQPSSQGFGGIVRAAVTDIHVLPNGFLSCGGDGSVKLIQLRK